MHRDGRGRNPHRSPGSVQVDLSVCNEMGAEQLRLPDIPVNPGAASVIYQESMTFAKAAPTMKLIVRLIGRDESGGERLLGEYTFNHTRSMPGPGKPATDALLELIRSTSLGTRYFPPRPFRKCLSSSRQQSEPGR